MECDLCSKAITSRDEHMIVEMMPAELSYWICSPSCLVEYAWKLKEAQPKLSKNKFGEPGDLGGLGV